MDHPESGRSQWVVANAFLTVGDVESSVRAFQRAKGIFGWPGNFVLEAEAGERLMEADRPLEAIPFLRDAIRLDSLHPDPRRLLALAHQNLGNWVEAERAAASALAVGGEDPGMHHLRAGALEILGRPEDAIVHRLRVIELADSAGWLPWVWLSTAQRDAGRGSAACASLDSARTRVPGESERSTVDSLRALVPGCS